MYTPGKSSLMVCFVNFQKIVCCPLIYSVEILNQNITCKDFSLPLNDSSDSQTKSYGEGFKS